MRTKSRRCPYSLSSRGRLLNLIYSHQEIEEPADISMKIRDGGLGKPFRVRFDDSQSAWVVSTLEYR